MNQRVSISMARMCSVVIVIAIAICGNSAAGDEPVVESQMGQLVQRLEQAEARIRELEGTASDAGTTASGVSYSRQIDESIEKRLETLENNWLSLQDTQDTFDDYFIKDGSSNSNMTVSGRIHGDYWSIPNHDAATAGLEGGDPQDRFVWRRVRFGVKGSIKDNMEYKIEMEFADPNDTEYRDLYIGWNDLPFFQTLLIGNQKRPYGLDHINSSRYNVFLERPFIVEAFNDDARRLGIASYGVSEDQVYNWRYGVYNGEKTQDDAGYVSDHYQLELAGRLASTPWYDESTGGRSYFHWAVSGTTAYPDGHGSGDAPNVARFHTRPEARMSSRWLNTDRIEFAQNYRLLGLESVLNLGPMQLVGEIEQTWMDRDSGASDLYFWGGYGYVSYFFTGEHMPWDRETGQLGRVKPFENFFLVSTCDDGTASGWGAWQIAARWSYADLSDDDITGGVGESFTLGLNWHWNPNSRLQLNYINGVIDTGADHANYDIVGARFMVDF